MTTLRRVPQPVALALVAALAACSSGAGSIPAPAMPATSPAAAESVVVTPRSARIVVPLDADAGMRWSWFASSTPDSRMEYQWGVRVPGVAGSYNLGYRLFKYPGAQPASGTLDALVAAGQVDVFLETDGGRSATRTSIPLDIRVEPNRLVFLLPDSASVATVFGERPATAVLRCRTANRDLPERPVPVTYLPTPGT